MHNWIIYIFTVVALLLGDIHPGTAQTNNFLSCRISLQTWQPGAPVPEPHIEGGKAIHNNQLYIFGGFDGLIPPVSLTTGRIIDIFDLTTEIWVTPATPVAPMPFNASHIQSAYDGQYVWIAGGFYGTNPGVAEDTVWRYEFATDTWISSSDPGAPFPSLPAPRASGGFVFHDGLLHYISGASLDRTTMYADHWTLDPTNPTAWQVRAPFPSPRNHFQAVSLNGSIYVMGGQQGHDGFFKDFSTAFRYTGIVTDQWLPLANLLHSRSHAEMATISYKHFILIAGGRSVINDPTDPNDTTHVDRNLLTTFHAYNTLSNTWQYVGELPKFWHVPIMINHGNQIFATAGGNQWNEFQYETWVTTITDNCADNLPPTPETATPPEPEPQETQIVETATPDIRVFDPALSKLGLLLPGQIGLTGEKLEWVITVRNNGTASGFNIQLRDVLNPALQIDNVVSPKGIVDISGQTVTLTVAELTPGEQFTYSIFTTVLDSDITINNTVCLEADNLSAETCASGQPVKILPATGEYTAATARYMTVLLASVIFIGLYDFFRKAWHR